MNSSPCVSVVIPTRNRRSALEKVLPTYLAQKEVKDIFLVIDGSHDSTRAYVESLDDPRIQMVENETSRGAPYCRNTALKQATGEFILVTDDDVLLEPNHLARLLEEMRSNPADLIAGRRIYLKSHEALQAAVERTKVNTRPLMDFHSFLVNPELNAPCDLETPFLSATMLMTRRVAQTTAYDELLGGNAFREETDFQLSAMEQGYRVWLCPHTACFHLPHEDSVGGGQYQRSRLAFQYWSIRNHFRFLERHYRTLNRLSSRDWSVGRWKVDFLWYTCKRPVQKTIKPFTLRRGLRP